MENASEALLIVFAVLVFVIALSVAMNSFNQVKATSDVVLAKSDITNFYEYQEASGSESQNRVVGLETIIPTLYKYYKENYTVLFREGDLDPLTGRPTNTKPLIVYTTEAKYKKGVTYQWGKADGTQCTYDTFMQNKYSPYFENGYTKVGSQDIFSFDVEEESARKEPWLSVNDKKEIFVKENLDCFLSGSTYKRPTDNSDYIKYASFIATYKESKFIETIGEYKKASNQSLASSLKDGDIQYGSTVGDLTVDKNNRTDYKRIVIFTLIK